VVTKGFRRLRRGQLRQSEGGVYSGKPARADEPPGPNYECGVLVGSVVVGPCRLAGPAVRELMMPASVVASCLSEPAKRGRVAVRFRGEVAAEAAATVSGFRWTSAP
jgi:hypothetical protein